MGRQSSRILYMGFDHKDIYFQGNYHKQMYLTDSEGNPELLWEKLEDSTNYSTYTSYYETQTVKFDICPTSGELFDGYNKDEASFYFQCNSAYHTMSVSKSEYGGSDGIPKGAIYTLSFTNNTSSNRDCSFGLVTKVPLYKYVAYGEGGYDHYIGGGHDNTRYALVIKSAIPTVKRFSGTGAYEFYQDTPAVAFRGMIKNEAGANLLSNCKTLPHANFMFAHCCYVHTTGETLPRLLSPLTSCTEYDFTFFNFYCYKYSSSGGSRASMIDTTIYPTGMFNSNMVSCHGTFMWNKASIPNEIFANSGNLMDIGCAFAHSTITNDISSMFTSTYSGLLGEQYSRFDEGFYRYIYRLGEVKVDCINGYLQNWYDSGSSGFNEFVRAKEDVDLNTKDGEEGVYPRRSNVIGFNEPIHRWINYTESNGTDIGVRLNESISAESNGFSAVLVGGMYKAFQDCTITATNMSATMLDGCSGACLYGTFTSLNTTVLPALWQNSGLFGSGSRDLFYPLCRYQYTWQYIDGDTQKVVTETREDDLDITAGKCFGYSSSAENATQASLAGWLGEYTSAEETE